MALRTALLDVPLWHEAPLTINATHLEVFTDGSASGPSEPLRTAPAGWAFTVWVVAGQRSYFYGAAYSTAVPPGTPFYLGETRDTPLQSELLGICWALAWLFEYGPAFQLPCTLRFDCQAAGRGTFCQATPAALPAMDGHPSISRLAVLLRQCIERRMHLRGDYVPGHAGHLGNELSDSFAKYARCYIQPLEERVLPSWPARLSQRSLVSWAWLCAAPIVDLPTLFAFEPTAGYLQTRPPADRSPPVAGLIQASAALAAEMPALESADAALSSITVELRRPCLQSAPASLPALSPFVPMPRSRAFSDTVQSATWRWAWARKQPCWRKPGAPLSQRVGCWLRRDPDHDRQ